MFFNKVDIFLRLEKCKALKTKEFKKKICLYTKGKFSFVGVPYGNDNLKLFGIFVGTKNSDYYKYLKEYLEDYCGQHNFSLVER